MDKATEQRAAQLESLLPRLTRAMFRVESNEEWVELPVGQIRVMRMLFAAPSTPSELGASLGLSVSAITQVVNRLEAMGYVARSEDSGDRRVRHLKLTHSGQDLMEKRQSARVRQAQIALSSLPPDRQQAVIDILEELVQACNDAAEYEDDATSPIAEVEHTLPLIPRYTPHPNPL